MNKVIVAILVVLVLGAGSYFLLFKNQSGTATPPSQTPTPKQPLLSSQFSTPIKAAHYESNTPEHGAVLAGVPINVVVDFNFDLVAGSEIKIESSGKDYGVGETIIDKNKLVMRKQVNPDAPSGLYTVSYKACWADGSCHDGRFQFTVDRLAQGDFVDMTGQQEVTINLQNIAFNPAKVKVTKGTKVIWKNLDNVVHTVNTDAHPAHTYYLSQNSRDLANGDSYTVTFAEEGIYLYHCTPHATVMSGQILVE